MEFKAPEGGMIKPGFANKGRVSPRVKSLSPINKCAKRCKPRDIAERMELMERAAPYLTSPIVKHDNVFDSGLKLDWFALA